MVRATCCRSSRTLPVTRAWLSVCICVAVLGSPSASFSLVAHMVDASVQGQHARARVTDDPYMPLSRLSLMWLLHMGDWGSFMRASFSPCMHNCVDECAHEKGCRSCAHSRRECVMEQVDGGPALMQHIGDVQDARFSMDLQQIF